MAEIPQAQWLERFAAQVLTLKPALHPLDAVRHAISAFPDASDLEPERAATLFAGDQPTGAMQIQ